MARTLSYDIQALAGTPVFADLSRRELRALQGLGTIIDRPPGDVVCRGDDGDQLVIVIRGDVMICNGAIVRVLGPGEKFGSGRLGTPAGEVVAATRVTLFVMGRREVASLEHMCPRLHARLMRAADPPDSGRVQPRAIRRLPPAPAVVPWRASTGSARTG